MSSVSESNEMVMLELRERRQGWIFLQPFKSNERQIHEGLWPLIQYIHTPHFEFKHTQFVEYNYISPVVEALGPLTNCLYALGQEKTALGLQPAAAMQFSLALGRTNTFVPLLRA